MFATGLAFLAGSLTAALSAGDLATLWTAMLPLVLLLLAINPASRRRSALLLWFAAGLLYAAGWNQWRLEHRLEAGLNDRRVIAVGEVKSIPRLIRRNNAPPDRRFEFHLYQLQDEQGHPLPTRIRRIRLTWRASGQALEPGQVWRLPVKLREPHGYLNPGAFDYERWLWLRRIDATGWVRNDQPAERVGDNPLSLARWRHRLVERLRRLCADCRHPGLVEALSVGYRGDLNRAQRDLLRQTGTAHLVAISGLHIGIIALCFHLLGRWLWRFGLWRSGVSRRVLAWSLGFAGGLAYALLSGLALPALRAVIMLGVMLLTLLAGRRNRLLDGLGAAVILVLLIDPLSVLSASFWLSFGAICVIAFGIWRWPQQAAEDTGRSRLIQAMRMQFLFSLLFLPLGLAVFGEVHRASLFANLLAVPLVSLLIVPFNFLLLSLSWLPDAWVAPGYRLLDGMLAGLIGYLETLRDTGMTALPLPGQPGWLLLWWLLALLALLMPRGLLRGRWLWVMLPLPLLWPQWNHSPDIGQGGFVAEVLDVGMGTSVVVRTRNHSLIYDFGPGRKQGYSMGEWAVLPLLRERGIAAPDRILLSHEDQDHVGGFLALAGRWPERVIDTGTPAETRRKLPAGLALRDCHAAPPWRWDGVSFRYLATRKTGASENDRSCVLRIESAQGAVMLLAGDIEGGQERRLVEEHPAALPASVLLVPHHGSESSSTDAFVAAVSPRDAVFTTGFRNRWDFPRATVVQRYRDAGARLWNTADSGALSIRCRRQCRMVSLRDERPRPWRRGRRWPAGR